MGPTLLDRVRALGRGLVGREAPDPRVAQTLFLLLVLVDLSLRSSGPSSIRAELQSESWSLAGLIVVLVAQVIASVTPWSRLPGWAIATIPVLDLLGLGMLRLNPEASGSGILAVVPTVWLVWQFGHRGAVVMTLACFGLLGVSGIAYFGLDGQSLSRSILDPLVTTLAGGVIWALLTTARDREAEADRRSRELAAALEQLGHTRAFADAIFDSVDVGLVLLDKDGAYLAMNRRHHDFMALAFPDGHAGKAGQLGDVFAEDGVRRLAQHEMPSLRAAHGEEFDDIRMWVGADPVTRRACSVSARSVHDADGNFVGAALAYTDVTDFLRSMGVKDDFVAMVSHEFRTPLTSIHGYVSLLLDEEDRLRPGDAHYLKVVARNTERLHRLVTDLLSSAQHDGRPMELERIPTNVCEIVRASVESARPAAEDKGLSLSVEMPTYLRIMVDPQRFAQVIDNLVSNAVKYTPTGGSVSVTLTGHDDHVELAVADTGIGIDPNDRDRLFTRFFRTRDAEERSIQGIGLGLSITKKIVETHGGRIDVESSDKGSTFRVWLPLDLVLAEGDEQAREDLAMLAEIERLRIS
ncbi:PAS domain-containing sensor histidine kinase [Nocardioides sp.]|uniref:sensor histidine kinase n=1 Tax=Nocardioides sp. TaxID=35761 RepID=UPI001A2DD311|nr:PAS domain-containing sensor histidine kinase [Nocardioides sp.]MBJ7357143.1 PAS domain-containing protein [Nocardioides sp.]